MNQQKLRTFDLRTQRLRLSAQEATWDTTIFGAPVIQISEIEILFDEGFKSDYMVFRNWLNEENVAICSCRLMNTKIKESMLLESEGFRFIEMVLHPHIDNLQELKIPEDTLEILPATIRDLPILQDIAASAFRHDRYHVDPRLDPRMGDRRYSEWVKNTLKHPTQQLLKIIDGDRLLGFFIVENQPDNSIYWHLTAISPKWHGRGYGKRVWQAMLGLHQAAYYDVVTTTISARNNIVLNMYSKLGFSFLEADMTFHWINKKT